MSKVKFTVIFGLTADPIHLGHEQAIINGIEYCREHLLEIDRFLLMPVYQPNLIAGKKGPVANFKQRFDMCDIVAKRLSKKLDCKIETSLLEKQFAESSSEKSYSYNTVKYIVEDIKRTKEWIPASAGMTKKDAGQMENSAETDESRTKLLFMVSADHFQGRWPKFRKWYKWQELLKISGLLINQRPGHKINVKFTHQLKDINSDVFVISNNQSVAISSSEIRASVDLSIFKFLSKDVERYVLKADLYGTKKGL